MLYQDFIISILDAMEASAAIDILECNPSRVPTAEEVQHYLPTEGYAHLRDYYAYNNEFKVHWQAPDAAVQGRIHLQGLQQLAQDWKGVIYFGDEPDNILRDFKIFDFHTDELGVGIYLNETNDQRVFLYDFSEEPLSLQIDLAAYLELLLLCRGFEFWPIVLRNLIQKRTSPEQAVFEQWMPQLFPDFTMEAFQRVFDEKRLGADKK